MFLVLFSTIFFISVSSVRSDCPRYPGYAPCTCLPIGPVLDCSAISDPSEFYNIDALQKSPQTLYFGLISVQNSKLTVIPRNAFGNATAGTYKITGNLRLDTIESGFLHPTADPRELIITGNKISRFPFEDLKGFQKIELVVLSSNQLRQIPDGAFEGVGENSLQQIQLQNNIISTIGQRAFAGPKKTLNAIVLNNNQIEQVPGLSLCLDSSPDYLGLRQNSISQIHSQAFGDGTTCRFKFAKTIDVRDNQITTLMSCKFRPLVHELIKQPSSHINFAGNPFFCDCRMKWLRADSNSGAKVLKDITCERPTQLQGRPFFSLLSDDFKSC